MARGLQKIQSQQKAKERSQQKKSSSDHKKTAAAGLTFTCSICKSQMPDPKTFKIHFESKHPKHELPPELKDI